jgi:hypothetical protein
MTQPQNRRNIMKQPIKGTAVLTGHILDITSSITALFTDQATKNTSNALENNVVSRRAFLGLKHK